MTDREKLIELTREATYKYHNEEHEGGIVEFIADYLISKGVTIPVRCGNCKHYGYEEFPMQYSADLCRQHSVHMFPTDFCSYGERKEE